MKYTVAIHNSMLLFTKGLRNGSVKLWNFNNGQCLRTLRKTDDLEISSILFNRHRILTAGWNKRVTSYKDSYHDETFRSFKRAHDDDIMSMSTIFYTTFIILILTIISI